MSDSVNTIRAEVDEILRRRRKPRGGRACYPCARRKVKCDDRRPCETCTKRDHPEICSYIPPMRPRATTHSRRIIEPRAGQSNYTARPEQKDLSHTEARYTSHPQISNSPAHTLGSSEPGRSAESLSSNSPHSTPAPPIDTHRGPVFDGEAEDSYLGENSAAALVRGQVEEHDGHKIVRDIRPVLGLQNPSVSYPYMAARTADQMLKEVHDLIPRSEDILRYFHFYRTIAFHFNPIIVDIDEFESYVCSLLERIDSSQRGECTLLQHETLGRDMAQIGLLLASLASGSQYCHSKITERMKLSRDFARRSFHCLKLTNYLLRPSMEAVQSLLILGHVMQNEGQSDGAWALLGTTVRLAQCLGLHTDRSTPRLSDSMKAKRKHLWRIVMWQDSLLSLCYDRPPAVAIYTKFPEPPIEGPLNYKQAMFEISKIGIYTLADTGTGYGEIDVDALLNHVLDVEQVQDRVLPHLQSSSNCSSIEQRQQFFAFRLQTSFMTSIACRPAFRVLPVPLQETKHAELIVKGKASLINATKAFLDLHLISVWARRSWSMTHEGLSSALLLGILGETHRDEVRELQQRLIDVLISSKDPKSADVGVNAPWLTRSHVRALRALRVTLQRSVENRSPAIPTALEQLHRAAMSSEGLGLTDPLSATEQLSDNGAFQLYDMDLNWDMPSMELSPFSYFDSLIWGKVK